MKKFSRNLGFSNLLCIALGRTELSDGRVHFIDKRKHITRLKVTICHIRVQLEQKYCKSG